MRKILLLLGRFIPAPVLKQIVTNPTQLKKFLPHSFFISVKGYCPCCEQKVDFYSYHPWLRDHFICSNCRSIPRERAIMLIIEKYYHNWRSLRVHESSPGNRGASMKLKEQCEFYTASQHYPNKKKGLMVGDFRNEDLENLTFQDDSFDLVITQDVMEHIYNPSKAFSEIARTLKTDGAHIFTVPLVNKFKNTEQWAYKTENGSPVFLKKPEFHGNPVDLKGSPVTFHWGYDIVDFIKNESGLVSTIEYINDLHYGVWAEYIEVIVSQKN